MSTFVAQTRTFLKSRHEEIAIAHRAGASGFATCLALSDVMDSLLRVSYDKISGADRDSIAIFALGGYGRRELCPASDVDVMVLSGIEKPHEDAEKCAKEFLHLLWDVGIDVGHSVRTVKDVLDMRGKSLDVWAAVLESRWICGNAQLTEEFYRRLQANILSLPGTWFVEGVFADIEGRHRRYGNSVKLLEPNVKKSAGGLRDFHALLWLFSSKDPSYLQTDHRATYDGIEISTASQRFIDSLQARGILEREDYTEAAEAMKFMLRTRNEMHYQRAALHDGLEYALQREVAEGLGYGGKAELHSVEIFMRDYYIHSRTIYRLNQRLGQSFRELIDPPRHGRLGSIDMGSGFSLHDGVLSVDPDIKQFASAQTLFQAFVIASEHEADLDFRIKGVIEHSDVLDADDIPTLPELARMFRAILNSRRVAKTLYEMNELNVLGRYIPEFGRLVAFFQHNVYHYYTADEHTLIAVANAEKLREQPGVMREVFRNLRRKEILYLAILLHDIAKPLGLADHEITGVGVAETVLRRLGMEDAIGDVTFLVRNHLVMEQIAFRRNLHDPETIKEFSSYFKRPEQLDYLYLLTYADLSAVNINVWTEWKSSLLQELYQRTSEVLRRNLQGKEIDAFTQEKHEAAIVSMVDRLSVDLPASNIHRHLDGISNESYVSLFSKDEIARHIQQIDSGVEVASLFSHIEGYTEVTVIARDAPFALSKFCGVLAANDANIFDANIFTRDDGIIIDRFRVVDASSNQDLKHSTCTRIQKDLREVMDGTTDIEQLFDAHRNKWKRRPVLPPNPNIRTDVEFEDNPRFTIIDVYAPDSLGFLYRVTGAMSRLGLSIWFAKIATRVDGIVDAFYTLDQTGKRILSPDRREEIKREILKTIQSE